MIKVNSGGNSTKSEMVSTLEEAKQKWPEISLGRAKNIANNQYGDFIAIYRTNTEIGEHSFWVCQCVKCGKYIKKERSNLVNKNRINKCNCDLEDKYKVSQETKANRKIYYNNGQNRADNILGKKFGKLTVIEDLGSREGRHWWKVKCDCGNIIEVSRRQLTRMHHCGCLSASKGEYIIANMLDELNFNYVYNKTYWKESLVRPDFVVEDKWIIEFDGQQHFEEISFFGDLTEIQKRDKIKNDLCKKYNIPLIRIPYNAEFTKNDLIPETSRFLLKQ